MTDPNLPPGTTDRDTDRSMGEHLTCVHCNQQSADCECAEFEAVDPDEYHGRYDDIDD